MNKYTKTPDAVSGDGRIRFYMGDCMDVMRGMPDGYWDLAVVDPPYGLPERSGQGAGKLQNRIIQKMHQKGWDIKPTEQYFNELFRVSKNQIIWGGNYFPLPPSRCIICWDKVQPWENFSQIELAWTSFDSPAQIYKFDNRTGDKIHPTQKPIALYQWLLQKYTTKGNRILDTHGGSMSSAIAADMEGFDIDIVELDGDYFQAGWNRFSDYYTKKTEIAELGFARTALNRVNPTLF